MAEATRRRLSTNSVISSLSSRPFRPGSDGRDFLLNYDQLDEVELDRRTSQDDPSEIRHQRQHLERLFDGSDDSSSLQRDTIASSPISFSNEILGQSRYDKKPNIVGPYDVSSPQSIKAPPSSPPAMQMWNPLWLKRLTLIGFGVLFALTLLALVLLYHFATINHGLSTQISSNHYSWTYGPTAYLILIVSLWRQVDYWCRALTPWQEMKRRPAIAQQSLLLDYISPNPFNITWGALKNRHWVVVISSGGLFVLKLTTIFSTALLTLQSTSSSGADFSLTRTRTLDGQRFNSSINYMDYDALPVLTYYGIMDKNLAFPTGTLQSVAFEPFEPASDPPDNATISADTVGIFPDLDCTTAELNSTLQPHNSSTPLSKQSSIQVTFQTSDCMLTYLAWTNVLCDPHWSNCTDQATLSLWGYLDERGEHDECDIGSDESIVLFAMVDMRYEQTGYKESNDSSSGEAETWSTRIANMTGALCRPNYSVKEATIVMDTQAGSEGSEGTSMSSSGSPKEPLLNFTNRNLTNVFAWTLSNTPALFGTTDDPSFVFSGGNGDNNDIWYHMMMLVADHSDTKAFFNSSTLVKAASTVFKGISAQIANQNLFINSAQPVSGQILYNEDRLHVRVLSVWLMGTGLVLMILATIAVFLLRPENVVPRDPTSIGALAMILASSKRLNSILKNTGHARLSTLRNVLAENRYYTAVSVTKEKTLTFVIDHITDPEHSSLSRDGTMTSKQPSWHRPMSVRMLFLVWTLFLPVAMIIVLEILQQVSNKNDGLVNIGPEMVPQAFAEYIPAAVMLLFATLISSGDSTMKILAPYFALAKGNATARRTVLINYSGKITIPALIHSLKLNHPGVFLSTIAAALASILTILVSGLYVKDTVGATYSVNVQREDQFNLTWNNSVAGDSSAASVLNLIQHTNLSYPQWTYDELAFPAIRLPKSNDSVDDVVSHASTMPLKARVPAMRASLNCSLVPYSDIRVRIREPCTKDCDPHEGLGPAITVSAHAPLPAHCQRGGEGGNLSYVEISNSFGTLNSDGSWTYAANIQDIHVGPFEESYWSGSGETDEDSQPDNPPESGCPSLVFTFGQYKARQNESVYTTMLTCMQIIEEVQTDTSFMLPKMSIRSSEPPQPDVSTVKPIRDNDAPFSHIRQYRIQENLSNELSGFLGDGTDFGTQNIDPFYQCIIYGPEGVPAESLAGAKNIGHLKDRTEHFYRQYMAQVLNSQLREEPSPSNSRASDSTPTPTYQATIIDPTPLRLKQDPASKLALQIVLAAIVACGMMTQIYQPAFSFRHRHRRRRQAPSLEMIGNGGADVMTPSSEITMRNLLPHNPCSIAGAMSLIAGSELVEMLAARKDHDIDLGAGAGADARHMNFTNGNARKIVQQVMGWTDDRAWKEKGIWEGWVFSLGWWYTATAAAAADSSGTERRRERRFGVDIGRAEGL